MDSITLLVGLISVVITTTWAYKIAQDRKLTQDGRITCALLGFFLSWLGLILVACFAGGSLKFSKSKSLVLIPALFVTVAIFIFKPSSVSYLTLISGMFIVASIWIMSLGLIFDSN